jgi:hypothetical protein
LGSFRHSDWVRGGGSAVRAWSDILISEIEGEESRGWTSRNGYVEQRSTCSKRSTAAMGIRSNRLPSRFCFQGGPGSARCVTAALPANPRHGLLAGIRGKPPTVRGSAALPFLISSMFWAFAYNVFRLVLPGSLGGGHAGSSPKGKGHGGVTRS